MWGSTQLEGEKHENFLSDFFSDFRDVDLDCNEQNNAKLDELEKALCFRQP